MHSLSIFGSLMHVELSARGEDCVHIFVVLRDYKT